MRVFCNAVFLRFVKNERISDAALLDAVDRMERGLIDADLGGGLIKQRIGRPGEGTSSGYRTLIAFRKGDAAFFLYGFAKNERENVSQEEKRQLKKLAGIYLSARADDVATLVEERQLREVRTKHGKSV